MSTDLLSKDGKLSDEEMEAVKRHTIMGEDMCRPLASARGILPAIRNHHERWDGTGFPDGLVGEEIPFNARILSIADSFDAMVSKRPYREGRTASRVVEVFKEEKYAGQWDPHLVDHFIGMMELMETKETKGWLDLL